MINKIRRLTGTAVQRLLHSELTKEFIRGFLPREEYLELKLKEICSRCPLGSGSPVAGGIFTDESVDGCREQYFGCLLQSFVGQPGEEETMTLYSYLRKCEECFSASSSDGTSMQKTDSN
ncbi:MAG: hypothetical protein JW712_09740 [Dehalococcoidales bacterium]|nr:hypothetical protein [Dehalococcoidales bacterium]